MTTQDLTELVPDELDLMVAESTQQVRKQWREACYRQGIIPRELSPIVPGMRSVR